MTFNELYANYYSKALLFVKSYTNDVSEAEDIVSESIITVWEKLDESRQDRLLPFLFTVLRNKCLDYLKSQRVKTTVKNESNEDFLSDLDLRIMALNDTTEEKVFSTEINEIIKKTLDSLPRKTPSSGISCNGHLCCKPDREQRKPFRRDGRTSWYRESASCRKNRPGRHRHSIRNIVA